MSKDEKSADKPNGKSGLPLPSPEPATNLLITDIVLRGATKKLRETLRDRMVLARYDPDKARELVDGRTIITSIGLYGASRLAAKSSAGLAIVTGGLVLKALYDRGKARQMTPRDEES